jgi:peroxiredoxin
LTSPQSCGFRDVNADFAHRGVRVLGLSSQDTAYQSEAADRLHLPFLLLSDAHFELTDALRLPTFEVDGMRLIKRLTFVALDGVIEHVFYPVFPPNTNALDVLAWLALNEATAIARGPER